MEVDRACALSIVATAALSTAVMLLSLEYLPECGKRRGHRLLSLGFQIGTEIGKILHRHIGIKMMFHVVIVAVDDIAIDGIRPVSAGIQKYIAF